MSESALDGDRLRLARLNAGMNQQELAQMTGVTQSHISSMEKGYRAPSIDVLRKLATTLGVSVHWLCAEDVAHQRLPQEMRPEVLVEDPDAATGLIALAGDARLIEALAITQEEWAGLRTLSWPGLSKEGYVAVLLALRGHS